MKWYIWLVIALVAIAALSIVMAVVNKLYIKKYGFNLYKGGFLMALALGAFVGGGFVIGSQLIAGVALLCAGGIISLLTLLYDIKNAEREPEPELLYASCFSAFRS